MKISDLHIEIIKRCQKSPIFFLKNFGKTKHPSAGVIPLNPFHYQKKALNTFRKERFVIFRKTRQAGASKISGAYALWRALFFANKTILIVSRTDEDAMTFLRENIRFLFDHLPPWMRELWAPTKNNEHEMVFPNGSRIRSLTSHPDVLRSNASSLNIIDEAAFIENMGLMWQAGFPTLMHGGCLSSGTIISGPRLSTIESWHTGGGRWVPSGGIAATDTGIGHIEGALDNGVSDVVTITTNNGHYVESTADHKFRTLNNGAYEWKTASDIKQGDLMVLSDRPSMSSLSPVELDCDIFSVHQSGCKLCGHDYDKLMLAKVSTSDDGFCASCITTKRMIQDSAGLPTILNENLATLLGIIWGDGFMQPSGRFGISFDVSYIDIADKISELMVSAGITNPAHVSSLSDNQIRGCNKALYLLLQKNGLVKQDCLNLRVPKIVLQSKLTITAFLRGLFEADGSICNRQVTISSACLPFIRQIQTILLSLGIRSHISEIKAGNGRFSDAPHWVLRLKTLRDVVLFRTSIGFISDNKCAKLASVQLGRIHCDSITDKCAIDDAWEVLKKLGLSKLNKNFYQRVLRCRSTGSWPRHLAMELIDVLPEFASTTIGWLAANNLFVDKVCEIGCGRANTWDLTESTRHTYIANGFVSHNSCIVISTVSGVGTWYWNTWEDAKAGTNKFCPLTIEWWDMDWRIDFRDELTGEPRFISPTHEIRKCETPDEIVKYGPYWSPWLEEQWQGLQERGEDYKFRQEVLAEFAGSGNTILDQRVIAYIGTTVDNNYKVTKGNQSYEHPVKVGESIIINFGNDDVSSIQKDIGLWVWREPIRPVRAVYEGGKLIKPAIPGHTYFGGVDLMTGRGGDYHALEIFDIDTMEQVAELMMRCLPRDFKYVIDFIGRWYNNAQLVVELNNGGVNTVDDLHMELMYPNLWRDIKFNDKPSNKSGVSVQYGNYGFNTGSSTKPRLNKSLLDHLRADDQGLRIYSSRLHKQLQIYVRKRDKQGRDTNKTEAESGPGNHDDLVMATGLALIGLPSALSYRADGLMPITVDNLSAVQEVSIDSIAGRMDQHVLAPLAGFGEPNIDDTIQRQLLNFANQLGALPLASEMHPVHDKPKYYSIQKSR